MKVLSCTSHIFKNTWLLMLYWIGSQNISITTESSTIQCHVGHSYNYKASSRHTIEHIYSI